MSNLEEQLNHILSSPESMQQVANLAKMLSAQAPPENAPPVQESAASSSGAPPNAPLGNDLSSLLGGLDIGAISKFLPLLQSLNNSNQEENTRLLYALKPFLKPERQAKVDRALSMARLFHVAKGFLKGLGEPPV